MKTVIIVALIVAIAIGSALGAFAATRTVRTEADVEVKVWRSVATGNLFVSTRPEGGEWTTHNRPLDMSRLSESGSFYESSSVLVTVPIEVEVPDPTPTPTPTPTPRPTEEPEREPGTCCEVLGMGDLPTAQQAALEEMERVVSFGDRRYRLEHSGPITINISYTSTGLLLRYGEAFGTRPETLPDECSFQRGEHMFFAPMCRADKHAYATEWFRRATGTGGREPEWIGQGTIDYFASHYAEGEPPQLDNDRFLRVLFYEPAVTLRRGQASKNLRTLAVAYAIREHSGSRTWFDFYEGVAASPDVAAAFEEAIGLSLADFYDDFEAWADLQNRNLHAETYASCAEAGQSLRLQGGTVGLDAGFPDFRVPSEDDEDGDGLVCEGFTPVGNIDQR